VGREVLNFQISYTLYSLVLGAVIGGLSLILIGIFLTPLLAVLWIAWVVLMILAAIKASKGDFYKYPFTIRFISDQ